MSFIDKVDNYMNRFSHTENGAVAYKSSNKKLTDFNFKISYYRNHENEIIRDFDELFDETESIETIIRYIFYIGDIREGLGERKLFRMCLRRFLNYIVDDEKIINILKSIPEYNRWDSLWKIAYGNNRLFIEALSIINNQLLFDLNNEEINKPVSLLAKWLPSENASSPKTKEMAKMIYKGLHLSSKEYRIVLSTLRKYLNVTEVFTSSNNWNKIDYEAVPSKANLIYSNAFMKHDKERRLEYLDNLKKGKRKINSSVAYPYEIIDKYGHNFYGVQSKYNEAIEQMWKALPKLNIKNTLVVRDGSGSMESSVANTTCLSVATSLAIYLSENNSKEWKDKFITFSEDPKIINLCNCNSLLEKLNKTYEEDECSNTDIYKTMKLILNTALANKTKQEEMPEMILIISDMQFDDKSFNMDGSLFDNIKKEFEDNGYELPKICFWNVDGDCGNTIPLQENKYGLILCSGFSINIVNMLLSGKTDPYEVLMDVLYSKRYDAVGNIFKK